MLTSRPVRVVIGASVFVLGVLVGAALAALLAPPV
jgi:hypothetical protein